MRNDDFGDNYVPLERLGAVIVEETELEHALAAREVYGSAVSEAAPGCESAEAAPGCESAEAAPDSDDRDTLPSLPSGEFSPSELFGDPKLSLEVRIWYLKNALRKTFEVRDFWQAALNIIVVCLSVPCLLIYIWCWRDAGGGWVEGLAPLSAAYMLGGITEFFTARLQRALKGK